MIRKNKDRSYILGSSCEGGVSLSNCAALCPRATQQQWPHAYYEAQTPRPLRQATRCHTYTRCFALLVAVCFCYKPLAVWSPTQAPIGTFDQFFDHSRLSAEVRLRTIAVLIVVRGTMVNREPTYGAHKNLYISLNLLKYLV